jgi:ankyrin repeat protein
VVRCLVPELGADVNKANNRGATPVWIAAQEGHEAVVRCLVAELGADVNQADNRGDTPVLIAAHQGHEAIARLLAAFGADTSELLAKLPHLSGGVRAWLEVRFVPRACLSPA